MTEMEKTSRGVVIEKFHSTRSYIQQKYDITTNPDEYGEDVKNLAIEVFGPEAFADVFDNNPETAWCGLYKLSDGKELLIIGEDALTTDCLFYGAVLQKK